MLGIIEWSVGDIQLNRGKFCFFVKIELCDAIIKQQKGGYLHKNEAKKERERVIGTLYSNRYAVYANTSVRDFYPSVEFETGNGGQTIWEWGMTEEMEV